MPLGMYYFHPDHLGLSTLITGEQGEAATRISTYGQIDQPHSVGLNAVTYEFTSQELDEETVLYYYGARFYGSTLSRFLNLDKIIPDEWNSQTWNRHSYVYNNPVFYTDPSSHLPIFSYVTGNQLADPPRNIGTKK